MLDRNDTVLVVIDLQERLVRAMPDREALLDRAGRLIAGVRVLGLSVLATEQNPQGLGPTVPEIARLLEGVRPVPKTSFGCLGCAAFGALLRESGRRSVLLCGVEAHVCVYQTARELVAAGYHVEIVADACSSRHIADKAVGLERARDEGAHVTSVETALFELLRAAEGPAFKEIARIVK